MTQAFSKTSHVNILSEQVKPSGRKGRLRMLLLGSVLSAVLALPVTASAATLDLGSRVVDSTTGTIVGTASGAAGIDSLVGGGTGAAAGIASLVGGGTAGCMDASGNIVSSLLGTGIGIATNLMPGLLSSVTGGLGGLGGGILGGILGGEVAVHDAKNLEAANKQIELLQKILAVENISCMTLQKIVAAIGVAGPAGNSQNPMVNLPVYAGKVFAMYRDTTQTADPTTLAQLGNSAAGTGSVVIPNSGFLPGATDILGTAQGVIGNTNILGPTGSDILGTAQNVLGNMNILGSLGAGGLFNDLNSILQTINGVIGDINTIFGGGLPKFPNSSQEIQSVLMNIFGSSGSSNIQKIIEATLQQKGGIDQIIQSVIKAVPGGKLDILQAPDFAKILTQILYVDEKSCTGNVNDCLKTTATLRAAMATTIPTNTFAKNAARGQNLQKEVRELVYGVDDKDCPANTTDKKCVSLLRMMSASSSLREDIQTNTAAVLTAMSFQLKELEALSESNIMQATPTLLSAPATLPDVVAP